MGPTLVITRKYYLRWRLDFKDHRPTRFGIWDRPGKGSDNVQYCNTTNLLRASIEGKDVFTNEIRTIADCDGHHFCLFRYKAACHIGLKMSRHQSRIPTRTEIVGLVLVTTDIETLISNNGEVQVTRRTEEDKNYHYATYGR